MEQYIVSARKYRPSTFASVVGQRALTTTLKNSVATDRLAHAYLFTGSRGVGKTSCARIFAKTINCTNRGADGEACNNCDSCRQFNENRSLNILELDAASHNGTEDIKHLIEQVAVPPATGRYRVFIIDEVHMLTTQAFNAFLKTLEEPPEYVIFILATTEKHKIIPTILSRCQIYDFNRITIDDMVEHMMYVAEQEGIEAEREALGIIAQKADGAMRDALSIFDQVAACGGGKVTYQAAIENLNILDHSYFERLLDAFIAQDIASALLIYKEVRAKGFDSQFFINGLAMYMRDLMVASSPATLKLIDATDQVRSLLAARAAKLHPTFIYKAMDICNDADFNFRLASNKQFLIELTLIKLCQLLSPSSTESGDGGGLKALQATVPNPASAAASPQTSTTASTIAATPPPTPTPAPAAPQHSIAAQPAAVHQAEHRRQAAPAMTRFSLKDAMTQPPAEIKTETAQTPEQQHRSTPFSAADFENAWHKLAAAHAAEPLLASALKTAVPQPDEQGCYVIKVVSEMQAEICRKEITKITGEMRLSLKNDDIQFKVEVFQGELPKRFWNDDRVLADVVQEYPGVARLIAKYQLRKI